MPGLLAMVKYRTEMFLAAPSMVNDGVSLVIFLSLDRRWDETVPTDGLYFRTDTGRRLIYSWSLFYRICLIVSTAILTAGVYFPIFHIRYVFSACLSIIQLACYRWARLSARRQFNSVTSLPSPTCPGYNLG
ncbi:hypothetical protein F5Y11DRAFT_320799 [Daldinia sp. FL1419]|nr:hypothetical protein F5Y11DRAFT_320799 [Daldinia sp. FL1419]